jgi:hypothetical protein
VEIDRRAPSAIDVRLVHGGGPLEFDMALRGRPDGGLTRSGVGGAGSRHADRTAHARRTEGESGGTRLGQAVVALP